MLALSLLPLLLASPAHAEDAGPESAGLEIGMGLRGSLSCVGVSLMLPRFAPHFDIRVGALAASATSMVVFEDEDGAPASVHPVVLGGTVYFGGTSALHRDLVRTYGGFEALVGHSFAPYDNAFGKDASLGPNVTLGGWGTFGVDLFALPRHAVFIEGGGGFKTYRGLEDREAPIAVATAWIGSGAQVRVGTRLYF